MRLDSASTNTFSPSSSLGALVGRGAVVLGIGTGGGAALSGGGAGLLAPPRANGGGAAPAAVGLAFGIRRDHRAHATTSSKAPRTFNGPCGARDRRCAIPSLLSPTAVHNRAPPAMSDSTPGRGGKKARKTSKEAASQERARVKGLLFVAVGPQLVPAPVVAARLP